MPAAATATAASRVERIKTLMSNVDNDKDDKRAGTPSSQPSSAPLADHEHEHEHEQDSWSTSSISTTPTPENQPFFARDNSKSDSNSNISQNSVVNIGNLVRKPQHEQYEHANTSLRKGTNSSLELKQIKREIETIEDENNSNTNMNMNMNMNININIEKGNNRKITNSNNTNEISSFLFSDAADLHEDFHKSPEPIIKPKRGHQSNFEQEDQEIKPILEDHRYHQYHMLYQIEEDRTKNDDKNRNNNSGNNNDNNNNNNNNDILENNNITGIGINDDINNDDNNINDKRPVSPTTIPAGNLLRMTSYNSLPTTTETTPTSPSAKEQYRNISEFQSSSSSSSSSSPPPPFFSPQYKCTKIAYVISKRIFDDADDNFAVATWLGFWAYLNVTCANYVLKPITDAVVLQVGVQYMPQLSLASSVLAFLSSVPIGWLFEAADPSRRKVFKKMGMTRGETQGTSLALFYRFFAVSALSYAVGFQLVDFVQNYGIVEWVFGTNSTIDHNIYVDDYNINGIESNIDNTNSDETTTTLIGYAWKMAPYVLKKGGQFMYIAFFLVVHLMKLHSVSLIWGVTTEAMEYEEIARKQHELDTQKTTATVATTTGKNKNKTRLQRLARIQFGGTLGGIWGSVLASTFAKILHLPGLLVVSAFLLEVSAELSIELGRIMQKHWEEQQMFKSNQDLTGLDPSMKRSASAGSMKRVSSGNSLYASQQQILKRVASGNSIPTTSNKSLSGLSPVNPQFKQEMNEHEAAKPSGGSNGSSSSNLHPPVEVIDDNTFTQRLLRGVTTILKSRLLMTIFTYNALFASTTVLLSFQRAQLVANRNTSTTTVSADMAYLANINIASSVAVFAMQSSQLGAAVTQKCGTRGILALMPFIRLLGLICLCWWHRSTNGQPPNIILFLVLDEFTRVINLAVAKPVRESLWSDLNNEARYEAKPIIDVLANRWGAGSASFCVSVVSRVLLFFGQTTSTLNDEEDPSVLGLPPVLFLGLIVSAWWLGVSLDLGQLRARIDLELKKRR